jgi:hypothetical protein
MSDCLLRPLHCWFVSLLEQHPSSPPLYHHHSPNPHSRHLFREGPIQLLRLQPLSTLSISDFTSGPSIATSMGILSCGARARDPTVVPSGDDARDLQSFPVCLFSRPPSPSVLCWLKMRCLKVGFPIGIPLSWYV